MGGWGVVVESSFNGGSVCCVFLWLTGDFS